MNNKKAQYELDDEQNFEDNSNKNQSKLNMQMANTNYDGFSVGMSSNVGQAQNAQLKNYYQ